MTGDRFQPIRRKVDSGVRNGPSYLPYHNVEPHSGISNLTVDEVEALRELLKARERFKWLCGLIKLWVGYLTAGIITLYVVWDHAEKLYLRVLSL